MFGVVLDVSMSPAAGPLVSGNRSDRGSHNFFFSISSVTTFLNRISMGNTFDKALYSERHE